MHRVRARIMYITLRPSRSAERCPQTYVKSLDKGAVRADRGFGNDHRMYTKHGRQPKAVRSRTPYESRPRSGSFGQPRTIK